MTDINDLIKEILALEISKAKNETELRASVDLVQALKATPFTIFKPIADLGYFGWEPEGPYKKLDTVTVADITASLSVDMKPPMIVPVKELNSKLPQTFKSLPPRETINKYPHKVPHVASLHVAARHRGVDMSKVSFFFGGSTLEMLATRKISKDKDYLVALIPGTDTIMIASHKEYTSDKSAPGFQFERFSTGKEFGDEHNHAELCHLQLMEVGGHLVLFSAEVDAMDSNNDPVEVTSGNPRYWGCSKVYQMISSGSLTMYAGTKYRDSLSRVGEYSLADTASLGIFGIDVAIHERNIKDAMASLLEELEGGAFEGGKKSLIISFDGRNIMLDPWKTESLFVPDSVIDKLLH